MSEANGYLVTTAINSDTGEAGSETYKILEVSGEGDQALYSVRDDEGKLWTVIQRPVGVEPLEVKPYRELVQALIAADEACGSPGCRLSMLGHLMDALTVEQRSIIRALNPDDPAKKAKP